jgi:hypothetical protein
MSKKRDIKIDPSKFLSPVILRVNLILASLYISAYEILKTSIIECTKNTVIARMRNFVEQFALLLDKVRPGRVIVFDVLMSSVHSFLEDVEDDLQDQG